MKKVRLFLLFICSFSFATLFSQTSGPSNSNNDGPIQLDPNKVLKFEKYCAYNHSFEQGGFAQWKANNPELYVKEMWYYTESFYILRDQLPQGDTMDESMIYVPRFEDKRNATTETTVTFPGFKDVMVLIPANKLIYKVK